MSNPISGFSKLSKAQKIAWLTKTYFNENEQATDVLKRYWNSDKELQKLHDDFIENTISNKIRVTPVGFLTNPSPVSSIDSEAYKVLEKTIRSMFPESVVVPGLVGGGTDARYFYNISDDVYRFYPIRLSPKTMTRFHGIDEKISKQNYKEIIEFSYHLIKRFN